MRILLAVIALSAALPATAGAAWHGPCIPGQRSPTCEWRNGRVYAPFQLHYFPDANGGLGTGALINVAAGSGDVPAEDASGNIPDVQPMLNNGERDGGPIVNLPSGDGSVTTTTGNLSPEVRGSDTYMTANSDSPQTVTLGQEDGAISADDSDVDLVYAAPSAADLNVGSYNIPTETRAAVDFTQRLTFVTRDIKEELPDILGVQELYESDERQQFITRMTSEVSADYQMYPPPERGNRGQGDGYDDRIVYRSSKVKLVQSGSMRYRAQVPGDSERWLVWGLFQHMASGRRVLFATTHLAPGPTAADNTVDHKEWLELIRKVDRLSRESKAYVVVVGDFNTSKFQLPANTMLAKMRRAGYGDVLGQSFESYKTPHRRAVHLVDAWVNSFNGFDPVVAHNAVDRNKIGNNVDWVFASNSLKVPRWRTVIHAKNGRMTQPLPSDHNMVSARIRLP